MFALATTQRKNTIEQLEIRISVLKINTFFLLIQNNV